MPKLIDAEAAKAAITREVDSITRLIDLGVHPPHYVDGWLAQIAGLNRAARALDALPDASEGFFDYVAKEAHRTGKSPQQVFAAEWGAFVKLKDDSLWPDASEKAIHAERIPVPPHLAEAQRVVIKQAQQAGDGAEEET